MAGMAHVKHSGGAAQEPAWRNSRSFRTFLLLQQFEAKEIGARIAQARKERGLTQEELAEIGSFSKRSLQDYETGVTTPYRKVRELSRLLGKPTEWFLYGDTAEEKPSDERLDRIIDQNAALQEQVESLQREVAALRGRLEDHPRSA